MYGADSLIEHPQRGADGVDRIAAITSTEDIQQALRQGCLCYISPETSLPTWTAMQC
ncbi:hypothetical protein LZE81_05300 [Xanthomonas translucens]|nr:hypothetical protein [Xanthomonas translucens]UII61406.1 hypothetical protein LZE81_05300 [Xanthomonas translucens]